MLAIIGGTVKDEKIAKRGGFIGGLGLGLLLILINLGLFMNIDKIQGADMPTLFLANSLSPILGIFMTISLLGMMFNTAVGMLYAFAARFIEPAAPKFKGSIIFISILALGTRLIGCTVL